MKKIYLSLFVACLSFISQAQEKHAAHYPKTFLTESIIEAKVQEASNNGVYEPELGNYRDHLYDLLKKQTEDAKSGHTQGVVQKNGPPAVTAAGCTNPGFEDGTINGWLLEVGDNSGATLPCPSCFTGPGGVYQITSAGYNAANSGLCDCSTITTCAPVPCSGGVDNFGGFPAVAPGGNYSLLINNTMCGYKMERASQTFVIGSTNNAFTFSYAAVLETGGHAANAQPYFHVDVTDNTLGSVIPCTQYDATAPTSGNLNGWSVSTVDASVYYKPWTTVTLDLSASLGHTVTVAYTVSDCNAGGHFGYAYIDGDCGQINTANAAGICNGQNANLCGPAGYTSYSWTGPLTGSSQCLSTPTPGSYTLNMVSSTSCPAPQLTYSVTAAPAPTASMSIASTPCSLSITGTDFSSVSSGTIANWDWNFGDGNTASSTTAGNTQPHTYATPGTYTVVMTCTTTAGCVGTYSLPVNITVGLTAPIVTSSVSCNAGTNGTATITPTGGSGTYTYSWSPSGGTGAVATGLGAGTYSCLVNDGAGCVGTSTVTIAQPTPLSNTSTMVQSTCSNFNGSATIAMSGGNGPYTYTWVPTGGNTATISGVTAGTYTCNTSDANNCPYTATVAVTTQPLPAITAISSGSVTCFNGTNGTATVTATGTGLGYSWSPSGGSSATASGLTNGTYTVTVTDVNSCTTSSVVTVLQATDIVPTSSVTGSICGGTTGSATVAATGGTGSYSYTWSPSGGNTSVASGLGAGNYNCTLTDGNNCTKTVSVFITTTTGPTITVAPTSSVSCNGLSDGSASVTTVTGGSGALTYTWLPGAISNTNTVSGIPAGTYTCVIQDAVGCYGSNTVTINQPAVLSTPVTTTSVSCNNGSNGSATINTSGGTAPYTYTWTPSGGNGATATGLGAGTYTCAILDAHNCPTGTIVTIIQPTPLTATATATDVLCNGGNTGTAAVTPSGGVGPYTYAWSPGGGTNASAIGLTFGNYVTTITDANLCTFTVSSSVNQPTAITATVTPTNIACNGGKGSATVNANGGTGTYTYSWTPSGGTGSTTPSTLSAGSYTSTVKDANGCFTKTTFTITQPTAITITSTQSPVKCNGASNGSASVNASGGTPSYTVTWNSSPSQTGTNATGLTAGSYTATVTDANGCIKTKKVSITTPEPKDTLTISGTLCSTDPNVLLSAPSGNGISSPYQWYESSTVLTNENSSTYTAVQANVNNYSVTWHYNGCIYVTTTVLETIQADLSTFHQTNIFTPNGDRINDEFYPFSVDFGGAYNSSFITRVTSMLKEYEVFIYDRWGKLMYSSNSYTAAWDGKHSGKDVPDGTYYWIVNYKTNCNNNKGVQKIKGFVQLLR